MSRKVARASETRDGRRARKQARILAAARGLLRQHGHERLSLRDVARRAGLSPAGMYEFFDGREHLVATLGGEAGSRLARALGAATKEVADPVERLVRLGLAYIRFAQRHPADFMLLYGRLSRRRSLAEDVLAESEYGQIRAAIADVVGVGRVSGADPRFLEALSYGFWSVIHGMAMLQLTHLAGFRADFGPAHRLVLESIAASWQRMDWERILAQHAEAPGPKSSVRTGRRAR